jgi:hypothetical protein
MKKAREKWLLKGRREDEEQEYLIRLKHCTLDICHASKYACVV